MPVQTLTEAIDNLYTTTWQHMGDTVADQVFEGSPFWFWMKEKGRLKTKEGGKYFTEPLRYAKSDRVQFIGRGGTVTLSDQEFLTDAVYEWTYLVDSIVRFGVDDQQNRGKAKIIDLMNSKQEMSKDSLVDKIEIKLFDTVIGHTEKATPFYGMQDIVADDPTASANNIGGIDPSTYTWWQNQYLNMTGQSFAVLGPKRMRTMLNDCGKNLKGSRPDIFVSGQTPYEYYEDTTLEQKRVVNKTLGDAGFENIEYKGIPLVWSPSCANTRMYMLNTNNLWVVYDPMMFFDMTEWKPIPDQVNDRAAQIITAMQLVTNRRKSHGVLFGIDSP